MHLCGSEIELKLENKHEIETLTIRRKYWSAGTNLHECQYSILSAIQSH